MINKTKCQPVIEQQVSQYPDELREKWEQFVNVTLHETNERNTLIPPSAYERKASSSDDEDGDFKDIPFPQDSSNTGQVRSGYQKKKLSKSFRLSTFFPFFFPYSYFQTTKCKECLKTLSTHSGSTMPHLTMKMTIPKMK